MSFNTPSRTNLTYDLSKSGDYFVCNPHNSPRPSIVARLEIDHAIGEADDAAPASLCFSFCYSSYCRSCLG